jgi:hypothetical protein
MWYAILTLISTASLVYWCYMSFPYKCRRELVLYAKATKMCFTLCRFIKKRLRLFGLDHETTTGAIPTSATRHRSQNNTRGPSGTAFGDAMLTAEQRTTLIGQAKAKEHLKKFIKVS